MSGLGDSLKNISPNVLLGVVGAAGAVAGGFAGRGRGMGEAVKSGLGSKGQKTRRNFQTVMGAVSGAASAMGGLQSAVNFRKIVPPALLQGTMTGTAVGAVAGGVLGGLLAAVRNKDIEKSKRWARVSEQDKKDTQTANLIGGIATGLLGGASIGHAAPIMYRVVKMMQDPEYAKNFDFGGFDFSGGSGTGTSGGQSSDVPPHMVNEFLKGVHTKAEAKSKFREQARKFHPDLGGSTEKMKEVNKVWEAAQQHPGFPKHAAMLPGFSEELLHIISARC